MDEVNDGGPAFPLYCGRHDDANSAGMSLRDYFAAKLMPVVLSATTEFPDEHWRVGVALDAYAMADAMLIARSARVTP